MVPLSSRIEKFKEIHNKQVSKYGKCLTIVLGEFDGKKTARDKSQDSSLTASFLYISFPNFF